MIIALTLLLTSCATPRPVPAPAMGKVALENFKLVGDLSGEQAVFTLTAMARVDDPKGGALDLLQGTVALTELGAHDKWRIRAEQNRFLLEFDRGGRFLIQLKFNAAVREKDSWKTVAFRVAPSTVQPVVLTGLEADTKFEFAGAAKTERKGDDFVSYLPSDGSVNLSWKRARTEAEGKLFYSGEMLSQISVSPGLMRQVALLNFKVMQGELTRITLRLHGAGEVTRVQGEQVLAWNLEPGGDANTNDRQLVVQFNQPQKDQFAIQVQMQTPLGAFPQAADALELRPQGATRFAGYFRIVNEGAVRLEVTRSTGLSQISPEQFPETDATRAALRPTGTQRFAYRFSGGDFALRIQADQVLSELSVSQMLAYRLGENEQAIEDELELEVREAPLRELILRIPKGYVIARLTAPGLSDYFVREPEGEPDAEVRLVYGQPVTGHQVIQLRLERNKPLAESGWNLPRIDVPRAKSTRGHLGISADTGFRLTPEKTQGLTEIATAFFPRKLAGIQSAFRLSDAAWQATLRVERLPQTIQADGFHLFSIGEGVAYGSSLINYVVSGAPVSAFRFELSDEYFNVEFTGRDIRGWQKTDGGYIVQLHSPVSGPFAVLATYERPFKSQGETLTFTGARPLDVQSDQGHTIIISAYQFQVKPVDISAGLLPLETGEVPAEYRLFFDAPILAAYRYTTRPFNLKLALSPLAQGDSLSQVVDRAALTTRISKEGQVLTEVRYFVKNRGNPHFRLTLPKGTELWSASVNGVSVVPVTDRGANLIPLPQRADPNAVLELDLKLAASLTNSPTRVSIGAPIVSAPVMLAEWKLDPDARQRLIYRGGSLTPIGGVPDVSGFAQLTRTFIGDEAMRARDTLVIALVLAFAALVVWRWASQRGVYQSSPRQIGGAFLGVLAFVFAIISLYNFAELLGHQRTEPPRELSFLAPVQQQGSALHLEVLNVSEKGSVFTFLGRAWPALLGLALWAYAWMSNRPGSPSGLWILGWLLLAWAALRFPNGAGAFVLLIVAFLIVHMAIPALLRLWKLPPQPANGRARSGQAGAAPAVSALILCGVLAISVNERVAARGLLQSPFTTISSLQGKMEGNSSLINTPLQRGAPSDSGIANRFNGLAPSRPLLFAQASDQTSKTVSQSSRSASPLKRAVNERSVNRPADSGRANDALLERSSIKTNASAVPEVVSQEIRVEDRFVFATAKIKWTAERDQALPFLFDPAVLTRINYSSNSLRLAQSAPGQPRQLIAERNGSFDVELQYELQVGKNDRESSIQLPVPYGLINRLKLTVVNSDVDVVSPQAVSVERELAESNTVASLVLAPAPSALITWKPRSRDVKHEKPVFYVEVSQLYAPAAGIIEGAHFIAIRPAQGELYELVIDVPTGATVTDVLDANRPATSIEGKANSSAASIVSLWRFDPDSRKLRVTLNPAQSRPFGLLIRSQVATGPLPFEQSVGLLSVEGAAGQIGLLGVATGNEVQLDNVSGDQFSPINLEDFPAETIAALQPQIPNLTLRRAFRYSDLQGVAAVKASAVEPDVRVETQDTLSLGEDRTILAANASVNITRAGIFRLSFLLPRGFDVESISGSALSHWTELKEDDSRTITLHLAGKTEGQQSFAVSLAGPGIKATNNWPVPRIVFREAGKQRGTLLVVPEQGMRLTATNSDGLTQLDPQKSGIRQKGVLAFRVLQTPWNLALNLEQVDPWVQVTSLQHAAVNEAQIKVAANLQYQIENTGLKAFHVFIPTNAETVRFHGDQVADFLPLDVLTNGLREWEVKLHRRVIGPYLLQVRYQMPLPEKATDTVLRGVQTADVNLQRGFVTLQTSGRLQVEVNSTSEALQPTEWQSIPRVLQQDLQTAAANFTWRLVEPGFQLALHMQRHEAARLLPARVNNVIFNSVISDDGVMLTQARLEIQPGDLRLLDLTLPKNARFWFAFVNQNGVWPWRRQDHLLVPLEQQTNRDRPVPVEIFYSCQIGAANPRALDLELLSPQFDLPLENITWRVSLSDKWRIKKWSGSLQLAQEEVTTLPSAIDLQNYLQSEAAQQRERTKEAETFMSAANSALEKGDPQQARRAFQAAFGLSASDAAFNEDARVQLHNIKLQQALVGLNVRQSAIAGDAGALGGKLRDLRTRKEANYSQQDAKDIIDHNSADENAAFMRLAERLIQQQDAAVTTPAAIRASIPEQGRILTFKRSVLVDRGAGMKINLEAKAIRTASWTLRALILGATIILLALFAWGGRAFKPVV